MKSIVIVDDDEIALTAAEYTTFMEEYSKMRVMYLHNAMSFEDYVQSRKNKPVLNLLAVSMANNGVNLGGKLG